MFWDALHNKDALSIEAVIMPTEVDSITGVLQTKFTFPATGAFFIVNLLIHSHARTHAPPRARTHPIDNQNV